VRISWFSLKNKVYGFFQLGLKTDGFEFLGLALKTDSYGLVIWTSKSSQRFLGLGLKIKRTMVYRLCHKIDKRIKTAWDMSQYLAACFIEKQVGIEFPSLPSRLADARHRWYT
jgi:hypothetical protein